MLRKIETRVQVVWFEASVVSLLATERGPHTRAHTHTFTHIHRLHTLHTLLSLTHSLTHAHREKQSVYIYTHHTVIYTHMDTYTYIYTSGWMNG